MIEASVSSRPRRRLAALAATAVASLALVGCIDRPGTGWPPPRPTTTSTSTTSTTSTTVAPNEVTVELAEFTVRVTEGTLRPGVNTVTVRNAGQYQHEVIFVKAPSAASLPTKDNGAVDMAQVDPSTVQGPEHLHLAGGQSTTFTVTLTAGRWVALCNIEHEGRSHFANGQFVEIDVT